MIILKAKFSPIHQFDNKKIWKDKLNYTDLNIIY